MAEKKPLCNYAGEIKELQTGDTLPGGGGAPDVSTATGILPLANGGTGASLSDPGGDRIPFWDDSAGAIAWLTIGTGGVISGTTITFQTGFVSQGGLL